MQMLRTFSRESFEFGLASWRWLGIDGKTPRFTTCFGDVFLESLEGWWFLDTVEGTLELRWYTAVDLYAELETPDGQATFLLADLVQEATYRGVPLGPDEVFTFNPHPAAGGDLSIDAVVPARFELVTRWAGQLHEQVRRTSPQPVVPDAVHPYPADHVADAWASAWTDATHPTGAYPEPPRPGRHRSDPYTDGTYATAATPARYDTPATTSPFPAETGSMPVWDDLWRRH